MLIAALDPELYLKSPRTQRRMVSVLTDNLIAALGDGTSATRLAGHRLHVESDNPEAAELLGNVFGVAAVETATALEVASLEQLAADVAKATAPWVAGKTFAVRPKRLGNHDWNSQDLAIATGTLLVEAGGKVDLSNPEVTVVVRVVDDRAYLITRTDPGVGGLPTGTQGRALAMFSGGIDSPVAAYLISRRGVALDYIHFSLGCGEADHAAGVAHVLWDRYGAGSESVLHVTDLEPALEPLKRLVPVKERQMALKALMYLCAEGLASGLRPIRALVNGESLGQVSTQTLDNIATLDRLVSIPVLRPLIGLDKQQIQKIADEIGTFDLSSRTREMCDISEGARVSVNTPPRRLAAMAEGLEDLVEDALTATKATRLVDWMPGGS